MGDRAARDVYDHQSRGVARLRRALGDETLGKFVVELGSEHPSGGRRCSGRWCRRRREDHEPYREIEGEVTPEYQVAGQPIYPETAEQKEQPAEHQQHDRPPINNFPTPSSPTLLFYARRSRCPDGRQGSGSLFGVELGEEALDVQGPCDHRESTFGGTRPLLLRTVRYSSTPLPSGSCRYSASETPWSEAPSMG